MPKQSKTSTLKQLNTQLKNLKSELSFVNKKAGLDDYITLKVTKDQARYERIKKKDQPDKVLGHFLIKIDITAKVSDVFIPLSISSGIKVSGFMYQIEGTAEGTLITANVEVRGEGVTQVSIGTLVYAKIPVGSTGAFRISISIRGKIGKIYKITFTRINYKLATTDMRYQQYIKEIISDSLKLS